MIRVFQKGMRAGPARKPVPQLLAAGALVLLGGCVPDQAALAEFAADFGRSLLAAWLL